MHDTLQGVSEPRKKLVEKNKKHFGRKKLPATTKPRDILEIFMLIIFENII